MGSRRPWSCVERTLRRGCSTATSAIWMRRSARSLMSEWCRVRLRQRNDSVSTWTRPKRSRPYWRAGMRGLARFVVAGPELVKAALLAAPSGLGGQRTTADSRSKTCGRGATCCARTGPGRGPAPVVRSMRRCSRAWSREWQWGARPPGWGMLTPHVGRERWRAVRPSAYRAATTGNRSTSDKRTPCRPRECQGRGGPERCRPTIGSGAVRGGGMESVSPGLVATTSDIVGAERCWPRIASR